MQVLVITKGKTALQLALVSPDGSVQFCRPLSARHGGIRTIINTQFNDLTAYRQPTAEESKRLLQHIYPPGSPLQQEVMHLSQIPGGEIKTLVMLHRQLKDVLADH